MPGLVCEWLNCLIDSSRFLDSILQKANNFSFFFFFKFQQKKIVIKNTIFFLQSLVNAKTYINSEQEFGRNTSLWKEWHKNTLHQKIFHIETPWNPSVGNYCYFRGNNISPLVLLLPLHARWRWTRAPAVSHMSVDMLPG